MSDAARIIGDLAGPLLGRRGSALREDLLARALLLAILAAFTLFLLDLGKHPQAVLPAAGAAILAAAFAAAGAAAWREWRGRALAHAQLLLGASGALAAITLARHWAGGEPARLWTAAAFLAPAFLIQATRRTLHGGAGTRTGAYKSAAGAPGFPWRAVARGVFFLIPVALFTALPMLGPRATLPLRDALAALALAILALGAGAGIALGCLRAGKGIDLRQRGKLLAAAEGLALVALVAAAALRARGAQTSAAVALIGVSAVPGALALAALCENLLWVDRILRRALALALALPLAALGAWGAVRLGGPPGIALAACLLLAAPPAAARLGRLFERAVHRGMLRRARALATLEDRLGQGASLEEVFEAARAVCAEAFPGVSASLLAVDPRTGDLREIAQAGDGVDLRRLPPDHALNAYLRGATAPLTRYDVLSAPRFAQNRAAWLKELDEIRAAALIPCRGGAGLQGVLLLGGQVRGGFFTEDEMIDAAAAAAALAPGLSRALALEEADRRIAALESRLEAARALQGRAEADGSRALEDLEESTRHVMAAYNELKVRGDEVREVRSRLAASARVLLAGRVAGRLADPLRGVLADAERRSGGRGRGAPAALRRARLGLEAFAAVVMRDAETPCDLDAAVDATIALLGEGWRGRIDVERKIAETPAVVWPSGALHAVLLAILLNADEAVGGRGTVSIEARGIEGRTVTVADAEAEGAEGAAASQTAGKIAWLSGGPRVEVVIADDGCGIRPEHQERLFDPFFTTKPRGSGALGLGLAVVADALARHGGSIRVESDPGQGTRVVLELPGVVPRAGRRASRSSS